MRKIGEEENSRKRLEEKEGKTDSDFQQGCIDCIGKRRADTSRIDQTSIVGIPRTKLTREHGSNESRRSLSLSFSHLSLSLSLSETRVIFITRVEAGTNRYESGERASVSSGKIVCFSSER